MSFINFDTLTIESLKNDVLTEINNTQAFLDNLAETKEVTWLAVMKPFQLQMGKLQHVWGIIEHLHSVKNSDDLRELHDEFLPKITDLYVSIGQNSSLFKLVKNIAKNDSTLNAEQHKVLDNDLRDFKLAGIDLPEAEKVLYKSVQSRLSEMSSKFEHNVLDATDSYSYYAKFEELDGIAEDVVAMYKNLAVAEDRQDEYKITLHMPSYLPVMQYAKNRELREKMYKAYVTRASDLSQNAKYDNAEIIKGILRLREQKAHILNFSNYAEVSLATKMAKTAKEVLNFLENLAMKSRSHALSDIQELTEFAITKHGLDKLEAWDIPFYSEMLQQAKYSYSSNELKQYFQLPNVMNGVFELIKQLFDIQFIVTEDIPTWHADVRTFGLWQNGKLIGHIYFDLYARNGKQPGAWMNSAQQRSFDNGQANLPQAYIVCNFTRPIGDKHSLLSFDDVQTFFHEMGHGLHHLLTVINNSAISGISGVEWDAVELPSQFMENFAWDYSVLAKLTAHVDTGHVLPQHLFEKVLASRYFQSGLMTLRQIEFSIFDIQLHSSFDVQEGDYLKLLEEIRSKISVIIPPSYNRFANTFGHIFAGGYAAGYYSYKWAEVLSCDVFSAFEGKQGDELRVLGQDYLDKILSQGGIRPMMDNFIAFMGREPQIEALLKYSGLAE